MMPEEPAQGLWSSDLRCFPAIDDGGAYAGG
jgi:hypothetical protein